MTNKSIVIIVAIIILFILGFSAFYRVDQTEYALVVQLGKPIKAVKTPGLHFKTPFLQQVIFFEKWLLIYDSAASEIITRDKKKLVVDNYAQWRIIHPLKFYQTVKNQVGAQSRLDDIIFSKLREELGKHDLLDIVAKTRSSLMKEVTQKSNKTAMTFGIEILDVRIKRADLPPENERAVYGRMRAEREREAKRYRSEGEEKALEIRAMAEKEKTIILSEAARKSQVLRGEGDAIATKIYANAFQKDPKFFEFIKTMESYKTSFREQDTIILTPESEYLRYLKESK
jgi:membrane protease subunit HflC